MDEKKLKQNAPTYDEHTISHGSKPTPYIKELYIECQCGTEGYYVMNSIESYDKDSRYYQEFFLCRYHLGSFYEETFLNKIKWLWKYLKTGKRFGDEILLSKENAIKLGNFLIEQTKPEVINSLINKEKSSENLDSP